MSSIMGCNLRRDHKVIVVHVTEMCSDKKTCAYQAATTLLLPLLHHLVDHVFRPTVTDW